jgi:hypothetical protein
MVTTLSATASPAHRATHVPASIETCIAAGCFVVALAGFVPSYWVPLLRGEFAGSRLLHVHNVVFLAWIALLWWQGTLADRGRLERHRAFGLAGIALATAVVFVGTLVFQQRVQELAQLAGPVVATGQMMLSASAMAGFAVLVGLAIAFARNTGVHRRLMAVATLSLLGAPIMRLVAAAGLRPTGPVSPWFSLVPGIAVDLLVLAVLVWDWRRHGRVSPVYAWSLAGLGAMQVLRVPVSMSQPWSEFARWFAGI